MALQRTLAGMLSETPCPLAYSEMDAIWHLIVKIYICTGSELYLKEQTEKYHILFATQRGIIPCCVSSINLFCVYSEYVFREIKVRRIINVGGHAITNLKRISATVLMVFSPEESQRMFDNLVVSISKSERLFHNEYKTDYIMAVDKRNQITTFQLKRKDDTIKEVKTFNTYASS